MKKILFIIILLNTTSFYSQDINTLIDKENNLGTVNSLEQMSDNELLA